MNSKARIIIDQHRNMPKKLKYYLGVVLTLLIASAVLEAMTVRAISPLFRGYESGEGRSLASALIFVILVLLSGIVKSASLRSNITFNNRFGLFLANQKVSHFLYGGDLATSNSLPKNTLIAAVTTQLESSIFFVNCILQAASAFCSSLFITFAAIISSPLVFLMVSVPLLITYGLISLTVSPLLKKSALAMNRAEKEVVSVIDNIFEGSCEIRTYGAESELLNYFSLSEAKLRLGKSSSQFYSLFPRYIIESLGIVFLVIIFFICIYFMDMDKVYAVEQITLIAFAAQKILPSVQGLYNSYANIVAFWPAFESSSLQRKNNAEVLPALVEHHPLDYANRKQYNSNSPIIELIDVSFRHDQRSVINNFSLQVARGDVIGITGPSGSGKTTLLKFIAGFEEATSGRISIYGQDIQTRGKAKLDTLVSYVNQSPHVFPTTLANNITMQLGAGFGKYTSEEIQRMSTIIFDLNMVRGHVTAADALGSEISKAELSGGENQRVSIARLLWHNRKVILLDEFTSALDPMLEIEICERLFNVVRREGITVVFVSHREAPLQYATKVISL